MLRELAAHYVPKPFISSASSNVGTHGILFRKPSAAAEQNKPTPLYE